MANNVTIGGVTVDAEDPCALYTVLYNAKLKQIAGEGVQRVESGDANARRSVTYALSSSTLLDAELVRLKELCAQTVPGTRKSRFAMRAGFRRYP